MDGLVANLGEAIKLNQAAVCKYVPALASCMAPPDVELAELLSKDFCGMRETSNDLKENITMTWV